MVFWSGYFPAVVQSLRIFNRMKKHSSRNLSNFGNSNIYIYIIDTFFKMFLLNEGYLDPSVSRKKSLLLNYSKFAMGDFSINNKFLQPRDREREKIRSGLSIWMKFHFRFPSSSFLSAVATSWPDPAIPVRISMLLGGCLLRVNHHLRRQRFHGPWWEPRTEAETETERARTVWDIYTWLRRGRIGIRFTR